MQADTKWEDGNGEKERDRKRVGEVLFGNTLGRVSVSALLCGLLGCLCFGAGDWLMLFGWPDPQASLSFLMAKEQWKLNLAMGLAFPGILFYGIALFALEAYFPDRRGKRVFHFLNIFGLTPWMALHLFYICILTLFSWMNQNGFAGEAVTAAEGLYFRLSWVVWVSEALMLPVFAYFLVRQLWGRLLLPRWMAIFHVFPLFALLKGISLCMPMGPFRMGFTNGLMSEAMALWFLALLFWERSHKGSETEKKRCSEV